MTKTMSITMDRNLYHLLKRTAGPRGISRFISEALHERLHSKRNALHREYLAASKDRQRVEALRDWDWIRIGSKDGRPLEAPARRSVLGETDDRHGDTQAPARGHLSNDAQNAVGQRVLEAPATSNVSRVYSFEAAVTVAGKPSKAMLDQVRCLDQSRLKGFLGHVSPVELKDLERALRIAFDSE